MYIYFYIFHVHGLSETFTAKYDGVLPRTKSEIYTPKRDDKHPDPFHMQSPPNPWETWPVLFLLFLWPFGDQEMPLMVRFDNKRRTLNQFGPVVLFQNKSVNRDKKNNG